MARHTASKAVHPHGWCGFDSCALRQPFRKHLTVEGQGQALSGPTTQEATRVHRP